MMDTDQPTPKYDQLKKRFMKKIVNEDSIRELQLGLLRLGQDSRYVCSRFLAKGVRHGNSLDGAMITMEFLDHCMKTHEKSTLLDEVDPFDLQEILESAHRDNRLHEEQPFQWPIQELEEYERNTKSIATKRNVLLIRAIIPLGERCLRRYKWLMATRMFHVIGKVLDIHIPESGWSEKTSEQTKLGYAFVTFQSDKEALAAAEAADNFPWPVKGRYNEEACRFEGLLFRRWRAALWSDYTDSSQSGLSRKECADGVVISSLSGNLNAVNSQVSPENQDTAVVEPQGEVEALAQKLQTLHRRLDAATISTATQAPAQTTTGLAHGHDTLHSATTLSSPPAKLYSPETKGKIAALLRRSVHEVRLSEAVDPFNTGASAILGTDPQPACLDRLQDSLRTLRENACPHTSLLNSTASNPGKKRALLNHGDIDRHIGVCARNGDLYEMVGWYQQKIRLLTQDFLNGSQDEYPMSGAKADGAERLLQTTSTAAPLRVWEDLQVFLDHIKSEVKASSGAAPGVTKMQSGGDLNCGANIISTLNEIALLLMSAKTSNKSDSIERLQGTVDHQNDVLERSEERIEELRDKVREYGREIAALEARNEEQRVALAYHRATGERLVAMERQKTELEREKADSDAKIARMQAYIDHLRETVASMEADRHWSRAARILASDSEEYEEVERKAKASGAPPSSSLSPGAARQAARKQAHDLAHGPPQEAKPVSLVQAVSRLQVSDWINAYLYQPNMKTLEHIQEAEAEMAGVQADLEAALVKFKHAKREVIICYHAKKGTFTKAAQAAQADKEKSEREEQNLCCICQEAVKSILLMPCRHLCVCQVCSEGPPVSPRSSRQQTQRPRMLQSCPVCRATITECLRVYA